MQNLRVLALAFILFFLVSDSFVSGATDGGSWLCPVTWELEAPDNYSYGCYWYELESSGTIRGQCRYSLCDCSADINPYWYFLENGTCDNVPCKSDAIKCTWQNTPSNYMDLEAQSGGCRSGSFDVIITADCETDCHPREYNVGVEIVTISKELTCAGFGANDEYWTFWIYCYECYE